MCARTSTSRKLNFWQLRHSRGRRYAAHLPIQLMLSVLASAPCRVSACLDTAAVEIERAQFRSDGALDTAALERECVAADVERECVAACLDTAATQQR